MGPSLLGGLMGRDRARIPLALARILLVLVPFAGCGGGGSPSTAVFPQPPVVTSTQGGYLQYFLDCAITTESVGGTNVTGPTYNSALIGPTFRMHPGADVFRINVRNQFPPNPPQARADAFPHDRYTTNLHTHGLTVDPKGNGDNVFRHMEPGTENEFLVTIGPDHPSGTFWYHPHKHGAASYQFMGGMAGFLILEGGPGSLDDLPEIKAARDLVMGFQTIRTDAQGKVPWVDLGATNFQELFDTLGGGNLFVTTNGVVAPTLRLQPGEVVRWRMLNATVGETLALRVVGVGNGQQRILGLPMYLLAQDGLTLPDMLTLPSFGAPYILGAGNRADVLVKAPQAAGTYELRAYNTNPVGQLGETAVVASVSPQGIEADDRISRVFPNGAGAMTTIPQWDFPVTLVKIVVEGEPLDMPLPAGPLPRPEAIGAQATADLLAAEPSMSRTVLFQFCNRDNNGFGDCVPFGLIFGYDTPAYWGGESFDNWMFMRDADDFGPAFGKQALFTPGQPLFPDMYADAIEEWTIQNTTPSDHPFHIHINPFLLTHINGTPLPVPEWRDTVLVPRGSSGSPGSVTFRTHFAANITGRFVAHCHILSHEDIGMMQELEIKDPQAR